MKPILKAANTQKTKKESIGIEQLRKDFILPDVKAILVAELDTIPGMRS